MKLNLNDIAKVICEGEGKKKQVNIAQVKEILRVICDICAERPFTMMRLLFPHNERTLFAPKGKK